MISVRFPLSLRTLQDLLFERGIDGHGWSARPALWTDALARTSRDTPREVFRKFEGQQEGRLALGPVKGTDA